MAAFAVSVMRGLFISCTLILTLPLLMPESIWFAMPITELLVAVAVILGMVFVTKGLSREKKESSQ